MEFRLDIHFWKRRIRGKPFFNTNILIYTLAERDPPSDVSRSLLASCGVVSVGVFNEFVAVARRKYKLSWFEVKQASERLLRSAWQAATYGIWAYRMALEIAGRFQYQMFDALVIAAALEASCTLIYSEDMGNNPRIHGLTIRNPFTS